MEGFVRPGYGKSDKDSTMTAYNQIQHALAVGRLSKPDQQQASRNARMASWREVSASVVKQVHASLKRKSWISLSKGTVQAEQLESAFFQPTAFRPWNHSPGGVASGHLPQVLLLENAARSNSASSHNVSAVLVLSVWSAPAPRHAQDSDTSKKSRRSVHHRLAAEPVPVTQTGLLRVAILSEPGSMQMPTTFPVLMTLVSPLTVLGELKVEDVRPNIRGCIVHVSADAADSVTLCLTNKLVRDEAVRMCLLHAPAVKQTTDKDPQLDRALTMEMFRKTAPGRRLVGVALERAAVGHEKKGRVFRNADGVITLSGLQTSMTKRGGAAGDVTLNFFVSQAGPYFEMVYRQHAGHKYGWAVYSELERVCLEFSLFCTLLRRIAEYNSCPTTDLGVVKSLPC